MISRKKIYALTLAVGVITVATPVQSVNALVGPIDATINRLNTTIDRLEALKAKEQEKIAEAKAKFEQAKTKAEELRAKAEQKKAEVADKKLEVELKLEEKKLEWKQSAQANVQAKKAAVDQKLEGKKLENCNENVAEINTIIDKMNNRREADYNKITKAYTAVQRYYEIKNLAIEDYPVLTAAVDTAQAAAEVSKARQVSTVDFNCGTDKPYTYLSQFHDERYESVEALALYRQSVKDLLSAVRNAAKADAAAAKQAIDEVRG